MSTAIPLRPLAAVAGLCSILLSVSSSPGATTSWGNTATDFNDGASWIGSAIPTVSGTALFDNTPVFNPNLTASGTISGILFTASASNYVLSGNAGTVLTLGGATAFTGSNNSGTNTISANLVVTNTAATFLQGSGGMLAISGNISEGANPVTVTLNRTGVAGSPAFSLSGSNSYTGGTNLSASTGVLLIGSAHALGTGAISITNNSGFTLDNTSGGAMTLANTLVMSSTANQSITYAGTANTLSLSGTFQFGGTDVATLRTITVTSNTLTISGQIVEAGGAARSLLKNGAGTLSLTGTNNTYSGSTALMTTGGVLEVAKLADGGLASSIGTSSSAAGNLAIISGGTLRYIGAGDSSDRVLTMTNGGAGVAIEASGSGALVLTSGSIAQGGALGSTRLLVLSGTNTGTNTLAASITNATAASSVTKSGSGKWILTGNSTYTGNTTVSAGTLLVNGAIAGTGAAAVSGAGTMLGGSGTIAGAASFAADTVLSPGAVSGAAGTLTFTGASLNVSNLDASAAGKFNFDLGAAGSSDQVIVSTGVLTIGSLLDFSDFNFAALAGFGAGTYTLFDTAQTISGSIVAATATGLIGSYTGSLSLANGNQDIILTVTGVPEPSACLLLGATLVLLLYKIRRRLMRA